MKYQVGDIFVKKELYSAAAIAMQNIGTIIQIQTYGKDEKLLIYIKIQWSGATKCFISYSVGDLDNSFLKYYTHYPVVK